MIISVTSSGPKVPKDVLRQINLGRNVKGEASLSGLRLINWIINKMNSELNGNHITMTSDQQDGCPYFNNTVVVTIPTVEKK